MHCVVWFIVFPSFDNGRMTQEAYNPVVYFCVSLVMICMLLSAYATRNQIQKMAQAPDDLPPFSLKQLFADILKTFGNKNYRYLLLGLFSLSITIGTHETLSLYMATFYWEFTDEQIGWLILGNVFGYAIDALGLIHIRTNNRRAFAEMQY